MKSLLTLAFVGLLAFSNAKQLTPNQLRSKTLSTQSSYLQPPGKTYDSSLASCQAFALLFSNTCDPTQPAGSWDDVPYVNKTCYNVGYCPSFDDPVNGVNTGTGPCVLSRKLCITCTTNATDGLTYIRVQANDIPDYCYHSGALPPMYTWNIDYQVPFNQNITTPKWNIGTNTTMATGLMCTKNYTMEVWIPKFINYGVEPVPGPGVTLAGSLIAPGLSGDGYDAFNTSIYGDFTSQAQIDAHNPVQFDMCMTHVDGNGFLHNHLMPGCNNGGNPTYAANQGHGCDKTGACHADPIGTGMANFQSSKGLQPVGITTDGHIVWGPYKQDGTTFQACDVDQCNGAYIGGYYGFVATNFFPYGPICYGGSTQMKDFAAPCSLSSRACPSSSSSL